MIYTKKTILAINIAYDAHQGVYDRTGVPYIFHPFHVAEQMDDEDSTIVALLHDVIEDTSATLEDLEKQGFSEKVLHALKLLTHEHSIEYMDYIKNIGTDSLATKVKLADLEHNMDVSRYCGRELTEHEKSKKVIYQQAKDYLLSL